MLLLPDKKQSGISFLTHIEQYFIYICIYIIHVYTYACYKYTYIEKTMADGLHQYNSFNSTCT